MSAARLVRRFSTRRSARTCVAPRSALGNLASATHGACVVVPGESFDAHDVLRAVAAERCTALYGVPTMFIDELEQPDFEDFDFSSLRTGMMAGAPCPVEVMKQVRSRLNMEQVTIGCGMTETSPISTQTSIDDPVEKRVTTVGRVHPHLEVKVIDPVTGRTVPRGTPGEQCTRGYSVMIGYWEDPEGTSRAVDRDGWMHTGDLAVMDNDGYLKIVGRIKDVIIRGGENVYPREVEEFLYQLPEILAVEVIGVPSGQDPEIPHARDRDQGAGAVIRDRTAPQGFEPTAALPTTPTTRTSRGSFAAGIDGESIRRLAALSASPPPQVVLAAVTLRGGGVLADPATAYAARGRPRS